MLDPDPAKAADDGVVGQAFDLALHAVNPEKAAQLVMGENLDQRAGQHDHPGTAEDDGGDGKSAQERGVDRVDLAIADRKNGESDHVGRVAQRPAGRYETGHGTGIDHGHEGHDPQQVLQRIGKGQPG